MQTRAWVTAAQPGMQQVRAAFGQLRVVYRHLFVLRYPEAPGYPPDAVSKARRWRQALDAGAAGGAGCAGGKRPREDGASGSQVCPSEVGPARVAVHGGKAWFETETLSEAANLQFDRCMGDPFSSPSA